MKMKKTFGFFAMALTALSCAFPRVAEAAGDIWSIEPYQDAETVTRDFSDTLANPLKAGETFKIKVRLLNENWQQVMTGSEPSKPWAFNYVGTPGGEAIAQTKLPRLGVWVSGKLKFAELDGTTRPATADDGKGYFTDIIFKYTVEAGDLALPFQLANPNGDGPVDSNQQISGQYYLQNGRGGDEDWVLKNENGTVCQLFFSSQKPQNPLTPPVPVQKWDFSDPGIYIQALDFDGNFVDDDKTIWREIAAGTTTSSPIDPSLSIPGGAADTMDLYVWTKDKSIATVTTGGSVGSVNANGVGTIRIKATATAPTFKILAADGQAGKTTDVYLAPTPTNVYDAAGTLVTNFITRTIKVVTPPPPYVSINYAEGASSVINADSKYDEHKTVLNVTLSQTFTENVEVTVKPELVTPDGSVDIWSYIGLSNYTEDQDPGAYLTRTTKVVIPAGSKRADLPNLYVYALASDIHTSALTNGIIFKVSLENSSAAAQAFYTGDSVSATLHINESRPVVSMPDAPYAEIQGGETVQFNVGVGDSYQALQSTYDVYWAEQGSAYQKVLSDAQPTGGVIVVGHNYLTTGDNINSKVYVISRDGRQSNPCEFSIAKVAAPRRIYSTFVGNDTGVYAEGETATVRIQMDPAFNLAQEAYVFIVPQNAAGSNYVDSAYFTQKGVRIKHGDSVAAVAPTLDIKDGCNESEAGLDYSFVIRSENSLTSGQVIEGYGSDTFTIIATNVVPTVENAKMGIWEVENNGTVEGTAAVGVSKMFSLTPADTEVDADLYAGLDEDGKVVDPKTAFLAQWTFYDGVGFSTNVYGSPYQSVPYTFVNSGKIRVVVQLQDKDLRKKGETKFGPKFTFYVNVIDTPAVQLSPKYGSTSFLESETDAPINITLTEPATVPIEVKVTLSRLSADNGNYPIPVLNGATPVEGEENTYMVTFPKGKTEMTVSLKQLDGTDSTGTTGDGIRMTATVTTEAKNADGIKYSDLYLADTGFTISVDNVAPEVLSPDPADTNIYITTLAKQEVINWRVKDACRNDMTNEYHGAGWGGGLKVTIMNSEGAYQVLYTTTGFGSYTNTFTAAGGGKWVSVQVEDKDGKISPVVKKYFEIAASKGVYIYPQRPFRGGGQSELSMTYLRARGIGEGRVWAQTDSVPAVRNFRHLWSYSEGNATAILGAYGYRVGDVDKGGPTGLNDGMGVGVSLQGNNLKESDTPYTYTGKFAGESGLYDSFLYAWIVDSADESSTFTGTATLAPQTGFNNAEKIFSLPEDEEDAESYADTVIEAIFSREYRVADNMGDINQDGVPDIFATTRYDGGVLYSAAAQNASSGGGDGGDTGSVEVNDLKNAWSYNGDNDFLPQAFNYPNPINPTKPGWGPGQDFKAGWEIRGLHEGLNYPGISDPDFSEAETLALVCDYLAAGGENKESYEELYTAATNWAVETSWNLERRTDPTVSDSDNDGYDDGFEYFFWYYAKAGTMVNGQWQRLTGSRFNVKTPGKGDLIPSEQIAAAFDPLSKHPEVQNTQLGWDVKDFDGDGLTDLEEYALGTNPCHWDSDGDGVSDFFEVMNGTDPLDAADGNGLKNNPDGDFMAYMTSQDSWTVVTVLDDETGLEKTYAYPVEMGGIALTDGTVMQTVTDPESGEETEEEVADEKDVWAVTVLAKGEEIPYYLVEEPIVFTDENDNTYLAKPVKAFTQIKVGSDDSAIYYLGADAVLAAGTQVKDIADAAEKVSAAVTAGFMGALEMFRYGDDEDGDWVPTAADAQTMKEFVDDDGNPVEKAFRVLKYEESTKIAYIHHQVYQIAGFDPRTAWHDDGTGHVAARWHVKDSEKDGGEGATGLAVNTRAYSSRDEFLLLAYRFNVVTVTNEFGKVIEARAHRDLDKDVSAIDSGAMTLGEYFRSYTTKTTPLAEVSSEGDAATTSNVVTTVTSGVHGADSDEDGIPDGWELYVNLDPNNDKDAKTVDDKMLDTDGLTAVEEFAGTDSCNAYKDVPSIYTNHPGVVKGWYNKFFPTDPMDSDTDGDGLNDKAEGSSWSGNFYVGRDMKTMTFTFIYGSNTAYEADMTTTCFRGGGLNPCTVDTDMDLLPDPWEAEFAGVVFDATGNNDKLSAAEVALLRRGDGLAEGAAPKGEYIAGGMDGTWKNDAYGSVFDSVTDTIRDTDWDHDGLQNYQEYLVQSLRHLRYDDAETPLMGRYLVWKAGMAGPEGIDPKVPFMGFTPMQAWDGEAFFKTCIEAGYKGNNTTFNYGRLGYFARPPKSWDRLACNTSGNKLANYAEAGYRVMLRPQGLAEESGPDADGGVTTWVASGYASTDPRRWDSDDDGMDDYYELFHGLNPLLGSNQNPLSGDMTTSTPTFGDNGSSVISVTNIKYDRIASIYKGAITSWKNAWTFWDANATKAPEFDAIKYPWMMGTAECDADGDGLRNSEEALTANLTSPSTTHTDPTPLWFTDSTSTNLASYVAQYYRFDPQWGALADLAKCWDRSTLTVSAAQDGYDASWMFAFEENEGYDTDHDFTKDGDELVKRVTPASDPLAFTDPDRRQAMWFPGEQSAVVSSLGTQQRPNALEYDFLRQFTAEAWIRPEVVGGEDQVILERVSNYGGSTLSNAADVVRANFRIGINADGCVYGEFQGSTGDSGAARVVGPLVKEAVWTHVALTFNGSELRIYVNGDAAPVATLSNVGLIPANGVTIMLEESKGESFPMIKNGYATVPSAFILGASALTGDAIALSAKSTWDSYGSMYTGWIDEVRVWDGARNGTEISESYKKRFSKDEVAALRKEVYEAWVKGARRNNTLKGSILPCELLQHYSFMALPGEMDALDVMSEPSGFTKNVLDNVRVNGSLVDLRCGWWASIPVHSTVYDTYAVVPWIQNTVSHLPLLDGSVWDSMYWNRNFAGVSPASESGVTEFSFPNSANPYPYWIYFKDRMYHSSSVAKLAALGSSEDLVSQNTFDLRSGFIGTSDLVPLGGAFPKRVVDMWDGNGASDAWVASKYDDDGDGLPDWWEAMYGDAESISWDSDIEVDGKIYKAWELYIRDLASGLLADGTFDEAFSSDGKDADKDGLPDWWEDIYGIQGKGGAIGDALADTDNDQLNNYVEYLVSEGFSKYGFPALDPTAMKTDATNGQVVPDYFLPVGRLYLGEMFTDHDFVEDWWERLYGTAYASQFVFDALNDPDDDGWSNYAEARAGTNPTIEKSVSFVSADFNEYPVPAIRAKVHYNGNKSVAGASLVVKAYSSKTTSRKASAVWSVTMGGASSDASSTTTSGNNEAKIGNTYERQLGRNPGEVVTYNLGNGMIVPGTVFLSFRDLNALTYSPAGGYIWAAASDTSWVEGLREDFTTATEESAKIVALGLEVGMVNYKTGDITIDFSKIPAYLYRESEASSNGSSGGYVYRFNQPSPSNSWERLDVASSFVRIEWNGQIVSSDHAWTLNLGTADSGHVREGQNYFTAFLDLDGNGVWTAGEPFGCSTEVGVNVGWSKAEVEFELTDTAPQMFRVQLGEALASNDFSSQEALNDRGVNVDRGRANTSILEPGTNMPPQTAVNLKVTVARTAVNGVAKSTKGYLSGDVLTLNVDQVAGSTLTEADLLRTGMLDLDWGTLSSASTAAGLVSSTITCAVYRVVIGNGTTSPVLANNSLATCFVNTYEYGTAQSRATPVAPKGTIHGAQPTFSWTHANAIGKDYPAFRLRVWTADGRTVVYDSGNRRAPARNSAGVYSWTAPIYADMVTPQGVVFSTTNNYQWSVSMLDAKFTTPNATETKVPFRLECSGAGGAASDYSSIDVCVKYFGPATISTVPSTTKGLVHVQAFTTPDFSGAPVGEAYVADDEVVSSTVANTANCTIKGLAAGTYYIRAFIDSDDDFAHSAWETWGYANYVGTETKSLYSPKAVTVKHGTVEKPFVTVYMEDMDTDQDGFPDSYEYDANSSLDSMGPASGNTFFTSVNPDLKNTLQAYTELWSNANLLSTTPFAMMLNYATGSRNALAMATLLGAAAPIEDVYVSISDFSLTGGLKISVSTEVAGSGYVTVADKSTVGVFLVASDTMDFADAVSVKVKDLVIRANDVTDGIVTPAELAKVIKANELDTKAFFKVKLVK